ncbi:DUF1206 domain-containing protein [Sphingomonas psychrotolerans]|uniref:DUF1206 domain-containing protein n=1 Tax=Sphingomonas psychrotolerans TaxID=1327635 RepID=A0A2K8MFY2_9SPHN|nr:DUF1206 domain-containing protein [Sphingomonas psychrotolerans]ATY31456.1 hypothetical protein CVN68_05210 [Sphingomonas psychrotolerans]
MTRQPNVAATFAARLGFAARGLVYLLVGWFALDAARLGSAPADNQEAMGSLLDKPLGHILVAAIAVGLAGYALWRLSEAVLDPERRGSEPKALVERIGFGWSALVHAFLAVYAGRLALHFTRPETNPSEERARSWSGWLLDQPGGEWWLGLAGLLLIAGAGAQAWKAYRGSFVRELAGDVPLPRYVCLAGQIGYAARAVVFLLIGWFLVHAAFEASPDQAGGIGQALRTLREQPQGPLLLAVVAVGLMLFGVYSLVEARFRRIRVGK